VVSGRNTHCVSPRFTRHWCGRTFNAVGPLTGATVYIAADLYVKDAGGAGEEQLVVKSDHSKVATDWSPDGRSLLNTDIDPKKTAGDLWVLPLNTEGKPFAVRGDSISQVRRAVLARRPLNRISYRKNRARRRYTFRAFPRRGKNIKYRRTAVRNLGGVGMGKNSFTLPQTQRSWP
jgi:hypothetical protein